MIVTAGATVTRAAKQDDYDSDSHRPGPIRFGTPLSPALRDLEETYRIILTRRKFIGKSWSCSEGP